MKVTCDGERQQRLSARTVNEAEDAHGLLIVPKKLHMGIRAGIPFVEQPIVVRGRGNLSSPSQIEQQGLCGNIRGLAYSEVLSSCAKEFPRAQV